ASQLDLILERTAKEAYQGFARGYIEGLAKHHAEQVQRINELLDQLQRTHPRAVYDLISGSLDAIRPIERLLAMVDAGQLPVEYLRSIAHNIGRRPLTTTELWQAFDL